MASLYHFDWPCFQSSNTHFTKTDAFIDSVKEHLKADAVSLTGLDFDSLLIFNEVDYTWIPLRHPSQLSEDCQVYVPREGQQLPAEFPPVEHKTQGKDWWKIAMSQEPSRVIATILSIEFAGSLVLSFTSTSNIVHEPESSPTFQSVAAINSVMIIVILLTFGDLHTPQLNPTATIALLLRGKVALWLGLVCLLMQILGCVAGVSLAYAVTRGGSPDADTRFQAGASIIKPGYAVGQAAIVEIVSSFVLSCVMLKCVKECEDPFRHSRPRVCSLQSAIAIGGAYYVPAAVFSSVYPNAANPSRALAMAIVLQDHGAAWDDLWVFVVFPICGCLLASIIHRSIPSTRGMYNSTHTTQSNNQKRGYYQQRGSHCPSIHPGKMIFVNHGIDHRIGVKVTSDSRHFEVLSSLTEWCGVSQCWISDSDGTMITITYDNVIDGGEYHIKRHSSKTVGQSPMLNIFGSAHSLVRLRY
eukprot:TRINITY_DN4798_c1_g1_i2.p1 TRINITY_DN4798_c1_g1~~TRINITY_DN4798_c1_g1_i2.p1  ORF type:complete len:470 (+),score=43.84 TRINITY_DN4798_c1_g1_i2:142-1551(+)